MPGPDALADSLERAGQNAGQLPSGAVQPCPLAKHWVEARLIGADDKGIPDQPYELHLADGTVKTGVTDADGVLGAHGFQDLGFPCTVSFTKLDGEAWELVR